jgi:hypothetical protein
MPTLRDLTGVTFGRLTVVQRAPSTGRGARWLCKCECGNTRIVAGADLTIGHTKSCGCWQRQKSIKARCKRPSGAWTLEADFDQLDAP